MKRRDEKKTEVHVESDVESHAGRRRRRERGRVLFGGLLVSSCHRGAPIPLRSACRAPDRRINLEKPVLIARIAARSAVRSIPITAIHSNSNSNSIAASQLLAQFVLVLLDESKRNREIIRPMLQREIAKQQLVELRELRFPMQFHQDIFEIVLQLLVLLLEFHLLGSHHH